MTPISTVITAVMDKMRLVPGLLQAVAGVPDSIYSYTDLRPPNRSIEDAAGQMQSPSMMLALMGIEYGKRGDFDAWKFNFAIYLRMESVESYAAGVIGYHEVFQHFIDGIPAGSTLRLLDTVIHANFDLIEGPALERVLDQDGTEYWVIRFYLTEIGG